MSSSSNNNASAAAANNASMSIMDKYQSLNRGIDEARRETSTLQDDTENYQMQLEALRDACRTMEQEEIVAAQRESVELQQEITALQQQQQQSGAGRQSETAHNTNRKLDYAFQKRRVDFLQEYIAQQRRDFCEESRDFRLTMKRLKLSATASSETSSSFLDTAVSHTFLEVNGVDVIAGDDDEDDGDAKEDELPTLSVEALEDEWHQEAMAASTVATSVEGNHGVSSAGAAVAAALSYKHAFIARRTAEQDYNNAMMAQTAASERSDKRKNKLDTLQGQLDRIRTTIGSLTHELTETHEQTTELQAMAEMYQQRAMQQQQQNQQQERIEQQARGGVNNRVATTTSRQQSSQSVNNSGNRRGNGRSTSTNNPYANTNSSKNNRTAVERQHPHLAGRIRMDRQFGGASMGGMHVIGGAEIAGGNNDSDDDIDDFVAFGRR